MLVSKVYKHEDTNDTKWGGREGGREREREVGRKKIEESKGGR